MLKYQQAYEHILGCSLSPDAKGQVKVKCPFHDDKNPSMSINLETGLFNCFGCGAKGNAKQFAERLGYKLINQSSIPDVVLDMQGQAKPKIQCKPKVKLNSEIKTETKHEKVQPYSLDAYADEKQLDKDFLLSECKVEEKHGVIYIPYFDVDGKKIYDKVRGAGKKFFYKKDKNQAIIPYGLWKLKEVKESDDIFIVEGESDTQTLWMNGYHAVGIPGINTVNIDSLSYLQDIQFRRLYIVSENDKAGAEFVTNIHKLISIYYPELFSKAYVVFPADLQQKDINDIWKLKPEHNFFKSKMGLLTTLRMNIDIAKKVLTNKKDTTRELRQLALFLYFKIKAFYDSQRQFWVWDNKSRQYSNTNDEDYIKDFLLQEGYVKTLKVNEITNVLKSFILNKEVKPQNLGTKYIYCANGEINYETMEFEKHDSNYFIHNRIPFNYNPNAKSSIADKIFSDWVSDTTYLYELIGYSLLREYPGNKIFFLFGFGNNGKSTFTNIFRELLTGKKYGKFYANNVASVSLTQLLENRFASSSLFRKYANLAGESSFNAISDTSTLKQLTGIDSVSAEKKFQDSFEFFNYAKLIFATNKIPQSPDTTVGWYRRIVIVEFKDIPKGKVDPSLLSKFGKEDYEYILFKSIQALHDLAKNNFVFKIEKSVDMRQKYDDLSDTVKYFLKTDCEVTKDENDYIVTSTFVDEFTKWLKKNKMPIVPNKEIYNRMHELGFEKKRKRTIGGHNNNCFTGIRFKTESENMEDEDVENYDEEF